MYLELNKSDVNHKIVIGTSFHGQLCGSCPPNSQGEASLAYFRGNPQELNQATIVLLEHAAWETDLVKEVAPVEDW